MELLVAGVIKLDLPVRKVYERVWIPFVRQQQPARAAQNPPMAVTYRLQGLDGEATEPIVESLPDNESEARDPEEEFAIATHEHVRRSDGAAAAAGLYSGLCGAEAAGGMLVRLLSACCKLRVNRRALLRQDSIQQLSMC